MATTKARRKLIKPLAKGQITIPLEFRKALGLDSETLLSVTLVEDHLEIRPIRQSEEELRLYTDEEISRFLEEDKLDPEVAQRVRNLLRRGEL
jgi:AbrB family looped-hinge helix DNA binding protein